jgi:putative membrane protein
MDRRVVLAGLATVVAGPALAQQSGAPSTMQPGSSASPGAMRAGAQMSQADVQHMQQTMVTGMVARETSRIALEKARNADLKQFAQFEVDEQTTLSEVLTSMMEPATTAATGSTASGQSGAAAPHAGMAMQMDAKAQEMMQKLNQASGAEFDREYLKGQIEGHRELLQIQERYLASNPQNREHINVTKLARGMIKEHIALLDDIQKKMG